MPVIVIGADTAIGRDIVAALIEPDREVRAFVSDPEDAASLKADGVKVACGDVSDSSHVAAACTNCFSAVMVTAAAGDERERSFADTAAEVLEGWAVAAAEASVTRVIWVGAVGPEVRSAETAFVGSDETDIPARVVALDEAAAR